MNNGKNNKEFEIRIITDMNIFLFVEGNVRGGSSQISKRYRYAKANNKFIPETYENRLIDKFIIYYLLFISSPSANQMFI